jgi:predicted cupin superfamily sugar epimerase
MFTESYFITKLGLEEHPEGGYFKELYRNSHLIGDSEWPLAFEGKRSLSTTIYYLLKSGQVSKFHRLKFDEIWFYHYGSPLVIHMIDEQGNLNHVRLGLNMESGESPQVLVPANRIFGAEVIEKDSFSLVSCMVSPGFDYRDFEILTGNDLTAQFPQHRDIIIRFNGES